MALPSSGQLSLNDIRVELQQAQANSSLGALSNLAGFTDPDAVSEFYGYEAPLYNTFELHNDPYKAPEGACDFGGADDLELYFAGSGGTPACPSTSAQLYTTTDLSTPFNGQARYWKSNQCNAAYHILSDGFIEDITAC